MRDRVCREVSARALATSTIADDKRSSIRPPIMFSNGTDALTTERTHETVIAGHSHAYGHRHCNIFRIARRTGADDHRPRRQAPQVRGPGQAVLHRRRADDAHRWRDAFRARAPRILRDARQAGQGDGAQRAELLPVLEPGRAARWRIRIQRQDRRSTDDQTLPGERPVGDPPAGALLLRRDRVWRHPLVAAERQGHPHSRERSEIRRIQPPLFAEGLRTSRRPSGLAWRADRHGAA
jgi:hypothetical protein